MQYSPTQTNLKPSTQRKPIHSSNHRLLSRPPTHTHKPRNRMRQQPAIRNFNFLPSSLRRSQLCQFVLLNEILSCAESLACTGNDCHAEGRLGVKPLEDRVGFPVSAVGDGVHGFGPVDGYEEDMLGGICEEVGGAAGWLAGELGGHDVGDLCRFLSIL